MISMELGTVWDICLWIFGITVATPIVVIGAGIVLMILNFGLVIVYLIVKAVIYVIRFIHYMIKGIFCGFDSMENKAVAQAAAPTEEPPAENTAGTEAEAAIPISEELRNYFEMLGDSEYKVCDEWVRMEKKFGVSEK